MMQDLCYPLHQSQEKLALSKLRILVAEDMTLMRGLLTRDLASSDEFEVVGAAANGREAVDLALSLNPDLVLMNLNMPYLNGVQAAERILTFNPSTKILFMTTHNHLVSLCRMAGVSDCVPKSCTVEELTDAIRRTKKDSFSILPASDISVDASTAFARLAARAGLSPSEKAVLGKIVFTDLTIQQVAAALTEESKRTVTVSSVKHAYTRGLVKLGITPHKRSALVKYVREYGDDIVLLPEP